MLAVWWDAREHGEEELDSERGRGLCSGGEALEGWSLEGWSLEEQALEGYVRGSERGASGGLLSSGTDVLIVDGLGDRGVARVDTGVERYAAGVGS